MAFSTNINNCIPAILIGFSLSFTQPRAIAFAENSPIILIIITILYVLLKNEKKIDIHLFVGGYVIFSISIFYILVGIPSKVVFIGLALLISSLFINFQKSMNTVLIAYTFLFFQVTTYFTHPTLQFLLPERGYYSLGVYSGTFAEPGYLAITLVLLNCIFKSGTYYLISLVTILVSGSFFGLVLMLLLAYRYIGYAALFAIFALVLLLDYANVFSEIRSISRLMLILNNLDLYSWAIIDQSSSYRFLVLYYNFLSMINNALIFPFGTFFDFELKEFLSDFYLGFFSDVLKNTAQTASSMGGYIMQYGGIFTIILLLIVKKGTSNLNQLEKFIFFLVFFLQSFAFDLSYWFILMMAKYGANNDKNM